MEQFVTYYPTQYNGHRRKVKCLFILYDKHIAELFSKRETMIGLWHEVSGEIRYEAILTQTRKKKKMKKHQLVFCFLHLTDEDYYLDSVIKNIILR